MHRLLVGALVFAAVAFCACKQDDHKNVVTIRNRDLTPTVTLTVRTPEPTTVATAGVTPGGGSIEVQGIIGVIDRAAGVITINPLQGTTIDRIQVDASTEIRSAGGRPITLEELRVSDRIIADGRVADGVLAAEKIAISQVVPGAEPGG
jgi:hypothetical protein